MAARLRLGNAIESIKAQSKAGSPAESRPSSAKIQVASSLVPSRRESLMPPSSRGSVLPAYDILLTEPRGQGNADERSPKRLSGEGGGDFLGSRYSSSPARVDGDDARQSTDASEQWSVGKIAVIAPADKPVPNFSPHLFAAPSAKKQARIKRSEGGLSDNKLKYPVVAVEPPSPKLVLTEHRARAWQQQVGKAARGVNSATFDDDLEDPNEPPLDWYADELHRLCGQALLHTSHQVVALQARHKASPALIDNASLLRPLLFQAASLIAGVCYHVRRAVCALGQKVDIGHGSRSLMTGSGRWKRRSLGGALAPDAEGHGSSRRGSIPMSGSTSIRSRGHGHAQDIAGAAARSQGRDAEGSQSRPSPPFAPTDADDAFATLHLDVVQLQVAGQQLGVAIRRLLGSSGVVVGQSAATSPTAASASGTSAEVPADELRRLLDSVSSKSDTGAPRRLQQLFMALPCLEEAIEHIGILSYLVDNKQVSCSVEAHFNLLCSQRRDQEDADAGIVKDSEGPDEADTGFDTWESNLCLNPANDGASRPASANRPASASASRPMSANRPSSASGQRRGVSGDASLRSSLAASLIVPDVVQSNDEKRRSEGRLSNGGRRPIINSKDREQLAMQLGGLRGAPAHLLMPSESQVEDGGSRNSSKRPPGQRPSAATSTEKGKRKKGRG